MLKGPRKGHSPRVGVKKGRSTSATNQCGGVTHPAYKNDRSRGPVEWQALKNREVRRGGGRGGRNPHSPTQKPKASCKLASVGVMCNEHQGKIPGGKETRSINHLPVELLKTKKKSADPRGPSGGDRTKKPGRKKKGGLEIQREGSCFDWLNISVHPAAETAAKKIRERASLAPNQGPGPEKALSGEPAWSVRARGHLDQFTGGKGRETISCAGYL